MSAKLIRYTRRKRSNQLAPIMLTTIYNLQKSLQWCSFKSSHNQKVVFMPMVVQSRAQRVILPNTINNKFNLKRKWTVLDDVKVVRGGSRIVHQYLVSTRVQPQVQGKNASFWSFHSSLQQGSSSQLDYPQEYDDSNDNIQMLVLIFSFQSKHVLLH
jgi:hypothetical protein